MTRAGLACLAAVSAAPGWACEPDQVSYFSCTFSGGAKQVEVCHDGERASYAFGPVNAAPELAITQLVTEVHLTPWPGIGRTIWEEVVFTNAGHSYTVAPTITRIYPDNEDDEIRVVVSGVLFVERNGEPLVELQCDPNSAKFLWNPSLFDAKEAKGQCYNRETRLWDFCS